MYICYIFTSEKMNTVLVMVQKLLEAKFVLDSLWILSCKPMNIFSKSHKIYKALS
jgi:hypothetical protein